MSGSDKRSSGPARPASQHSRTTERTGARPSPGGALAGLQRLQAAAGNAAVAGLLARAGAGVGAPALQRRAQGGAIPPPPVAPSAPVPEEHPGFAAVTKRLGSAAKRTAGHKPAKAEAGAAQNAAKAPADDAMAQAKGAKAAEMGAAKPGTFDKAAFIAAVNTAIAAAAPKNLDEADKFATSGASDSIAAKVKGNVTASKREAAKPLAETAASPPDPSVAKERPVTPLAPKPAPGQPPALAAGQAMPTKAPAEQTNLDSGPAEVEQKMADAEVTEEQLKKSNEPEFTGAVEAKKEGEAHSESAPAAFRDSEAAKLQAATQGAQAQGQQTASGLVATKAQADTKVAGAQGQGKDKNQDQQAAVSGNINRIFDATKTDVDKILGDLDGAVSKQFEEGERKAKAAFTAEHKARMDKYKDDRYSGVLGWGRWTRDLFAGLPAEANNIYLEAKKVYETQMQALISQIADTVGRELQRAKDRVATGRAEITKYVDGLDPALKKIGQNAAADIQDKFGELESSIEEKSSSLAEDLAGKYVEARNAVDEEIKAMQEANKGLWDKAKDAIGGAIETILKLKDMLLGVLARAAGAVKKIIADPIGFLGNFVNAVKAGVMNFGANILTHLKAGLKGWLFGALAEAGIEIPETFDLKGIIKLVLSLLGLTWNAIRARIVKHIPEPVMKVLETSMEFVQILISEGVPGLWKWIAAKLTDLKEMVLAQIEDFVITKVITAGITWLVSLLNPAAAFIKACKMIYDAVMWFVDNAARLKEFVDSVLDSVESIASGGVGAVAGLIENTLAKAVPMVISGLASLLGLGGIAEKIKGILLKVQKPVMSVVDKLVGGAVKFGKNLIKKLGRKKKDTGADDLGPAVASAKGLLEAPGATPDTVRGALPGLKTTHALSAASLAEHDGKHHIHVQKTDADTPAVALGGGTHGQRFLPASYAAKGVLRKRLYETGTGWGTVRKTINNHMINELYGAFDVLTGGAFSREDQRHQLDMWVSAKKIPAELISAFNSTRPATAAWFRTWLSENVSWHVDHLNPLAKYWVTADYNAGDAERATHATAPVNLDWITATANLGKGSESEDDAGETTRYHYADKLWVGPDFTSARAEAGKRDAKTIDGEPFKDASGKPVT